MTDKKIIAYGTNMVNTRYLRHNIEEMEDVPVDGINVSFYDDHWMKHRRGTGQEGIICGGHRFTRDDFSLALDDMQNTRFRKWTDNFLDVTFHAVGSYITGDPNDGNLDWFDPAWDGIVENAAAVGWLAREGGFKGLFFSMEHYKNVIGPWNNENVFEYKHAPNRDMHTQTEYEEMVELRGFQFMQGLASDYPDITVMLLQNVGWGRGDMKRHFVRGMLKARGRAALIDSGQGAYSLITHKQIKGIRQTAENSMANDAPFKDLQYAIGLWVDQTNEQFPSWFSNPKMFSQNYRSPFDFAHSLHAALEVTDKYVWIFTWHAAVWWNPIRKQLPTWHPKPMCQACPHPELPEEYKQALVDCRADLPLEWELPDLAPREICFADVVLVEGEKIEGEQRNMIPNSRFEYWTKRGKPLSWKVGKTKATKINDGDKQGVMFTSDEPTNYCQADMLIPVKRLAGKTVTFGAWIRSNIAGANILIIDRHGGDHELSSPGQDSGFKPDNQWHWITVTRTIRPHATGDVIFRLGGNMMFKKATKRSKAATRRSTRSRTRTRRPRKT